jgi:HTH-type transcriptional regulator/antitoxin HigA
MPRAKAKRPAVLPGTYAGLIDLYPLRPINDRIDLDNASEVAGWLAMTPRPTRDQADYLDVLATLIEAYETEHELFDTSGVTTLDILSRLLENNGMTASDLGRLLGDRAIGAKVLNGTRKLSKNHVRILCDRFKLRAEAFLR